MVGSFKDFANARKLRNNLVAKGYSPRILTGDKGFFRVSAFTSDERQDAVFAMNVGNVSDIVETQFGYHLIKLTAKEASSTVPLAEVQGQIVDHLTQVEMAEMINTYVASIKPDSKIERYAK